MKVYLDERGVLHVGTLRLNADHFVIRVTTSGGPGGQHANRTMSKVVVTFDHRSAPGIAPRQRNQLLAVRTQPFTASSSTFRSQGQNREAALLRLGAKLAVALEPPTPRRPTRPTFSSTQRRLESKKHRAQQKRARRLNSED
ncbi:MAG: aminoacyl-tRNA hydrolase [Acidobacteria bacterium]|nr:aminoacyl-tRNA hydrolase [Acidobacteriota bacterium]